MNKAILLTVGIESALALGQAGFAAVAAGDIWGSHDALHEEKTGEWRLHPDVRDLPLRARNGFVVF